MDILVVQAPEQLVFGMMLVVIGLTFITLTTPYKIIGIINSAFCVAIAVEFSADNPETPAVALVMIGFIGLGVFNAYYSVFGKD